MSGLLPLGNPELSELLLRALQIKGDLPQTVEALYRAQVTVDDLTAPEYRWLRRGTQWQGHAFVAAVAGQASYFELQPISGAAENIAVVERISIVNPNAFVMSTRLGIVTPALLAAGAVNARARDDRHLSSQSAFKIFAGTNAALAGAAGMIDVRLAADGTTTVEGPWILTGNSALQVGTTAANVALTCQMFWRERLLQVTER